MHDRLALVLLAAIAVVLVAACGSSDGSAETAMVEEPTSTAATVEEPSATASTDQEPTSTAATVEEPSSTAATDQEGTAEPTDEAAPAGPPPGRGDDGERPPRPDGDDGERPPRPDGEEGAGGPPPGDGENADGAAGAEPVSDIEVTVGDGFDVGLFFEGAVTNEIATVDCTLSGGETTTCHEITIAGFPADGEVGPFCPRTTAATVDEVGIWFDGDNLYDLDGQFILDLAEIYNDANWRLYDDDGNVNITETQEAFEAAARPDVAEEYQNHCVEGSIDWLENGEPISTTVRIPTTPVVALGTTNNRGNVGVTLNGVIIAAAAPVDAILGAYTIAAFDDCGGHINPFDGYHIHGATSCSETGEVLDGETAAFAVALDGFVIHSPYEAGDEAANELDSCNGHSTDELGYHYHAGPTESNAVLSCFVGQTAS